MELLDSKDEVMIKKEGLFTKENMVMSLLLTIAAWGAMNIIDIQAQNAVDAEINAIVRENIPSIATSLAVIQSEIIYMKEDIAETSEDVNKLLHRQTQ